MDDSVKIQCWSSFHITFTLMNIHVHIYINISINKIKTNKAFVLLTVGGKRKWFTITKNNVNYFTVV